MRLPLPLLLLLVLGMPAAGARAGSERIPIERFFAAPELEGVALSPDGSHLAGIESADDEQAIRIVDLVTARAHRVRVKEPRTTAFGWWGSGERRIQRVWWASDERLVASVGLLGEHLSYLVLFGRDGSKRVKVPHRNLRAGLYHEEDDLLSRLPGDPGAVLVEFPRSRQLDAAGSEVRRLELEDGDSKLVQPAHSRVVRWFADASGRVRAGFGLRRDQGLLFYRDGGAGAFEELHDLGGVRFDPEELIVLGVAPGRELYVASRHAGDRFAVYVFELSERGFIGPIFSHPRVDVVGPLVKDWNETLLGVRYVDEFPRIHWLDEAWARRQAAIDARLAGRSNTIESWSRDETRFAVLSRSDRYPPRWYLYDEPEGRLRAVSADHPLGAEEGAASAPVRIPTRDGLELPGYLTLPPDAGAGPWPFVVEAVGGGVGRVDAGFDAGVQLLASRGYGVLRFHTRGASGFGRRLESAGRGQWRQAVLGDVEDALAWLAAGGRADPRRICSYGFGGFPGYVALMALLDLPERLRCAATFGAITDLEDFADHVDRRSDDYVWYRRLGDAGDAALRDASPIAHAKAFRGPVFLARGRHDRRVPPAQSRDLALALERARRPVTALELPHDGGDLDRVDGRLEFYGELLGFLEASLAPPAEPAKPEP